MFKGKGVAGAPIAISAKIAYSAAEIKASKNREASGEYQFSFRYPAKVVFE